MVLKQQAINIRNAFAATLEARIDAAIRANAQQGISTTVVGYDPTPDAQATTLMNAYRTTGTWATSTIDTVQKRITIAP